MQFDVIQRLRLLRGLLIRRNHGGKIMAKTKDGKPKAGPTKSPWEVPPFPADGDANSDMTFMEVGRALSMWEFFEAYFGLIFGMFVGATDHVAPALRAYGSVLAFRGRYDMARVSGEAYFARYHNAERDLEFKDLLTAANGFSGRRNEIAHGIVQPYVPDGLTVRGYALGPSYHAANKRKLSKEEGRTSAAYAYTSVELKAFTLEYETLGRRAVRLLGHLYGDLSVRKGMGQNCAGNVLSE